MSRQSAYHVFALPREILDTLIPRDIVNNPPSPEQVPPPLPSEQQQTVNGARACNICLGATFPDVDAQRTHYRSDWHRYNVKMRLNSSQPVTEAHFSTLIDQIDDSISGSVSTSDDESDESDAVAALVDKTRNLGRSPSPDETRSSAPQTALTWFHSPPSTQLGIYKVLFPNDLSSGSYLEELRHMQEPVPEGRKWALFMTAGGHFAGAVVRVSRPAGVENEMGKKGKQKRPVPDIEVLKHKTFHRYTTRRKQGGAQSTNDNSKGKAVSAGAMLRRYGEQALRDDIRNLLTDWSEEIYDCERIFIRASVSNRKIFLDYEGAILQKSDDRLRTFPFPTRRPTQSELSRCLQELVRVKISHLTEEALRAQDEAYLASLPKPKPKPTSAPTSADAAAPSPKDLPPKLNPEQEKLREKWIRVVDIVSKGRLDAMKAFWAREEASIGGVDARIPDWVGLEGKGGGETLLQVAAYAGQEEMTRWLLEDARADPTLDVPTDHHHLPSPPNDDEEEDTTLPVSGAPRRTAYDISSTRAVRNVFRRCAATHPDWWDWLGAARVPSVLTKEMEEGRDEKKKVRRKGLKDKIKEREAREKAKEPSPEPVSAPAPAPRATLREKSPGTGPRKLGGAAGAADGVAGLTPEMRAKIERERRARAAEARMQALSGSKQ
ncbi:hypothetical protein BXZ70DRAFT_1066786 [Cristinia sonorae]|uniref:VLRF1 domain-containing protein n=1 Tax=Cristinia sonorae TaxID=1940300 RepID=A0A8K0UJK5_9AGAR|nr:hypothetical protein BXZ70DRAFT_1066786 [Cristinia sonorae]